MSKSSSKSQIEPAQKPHVAELLAELRKDKGLRQIDVAKATRISAKVLSTYETGARPPAIDSLVTLADFYDVTLDYFMGRTKINVSTELLNSELSNGISYESVLALLDALPPEGKEAFIYFLDAVRDKADLSRI